MLIYQTQSRLYVLPNGSQFSFPSLVEIIIELAPGGQFGVADAPGQLVVFGQEFKVDWNPNTGRATFYTTPPLQQLSLTCKWPNDVSLHLNGNVVKLSANCESFEGLDRLVQGLHYGLPLLLNLTLSEPLIVNRTTGSVGTVPFQWNLNRSILPIVPTTRKKQIQKIGQALAWWDLFCDAKHGRLCAGLYYFHVASRLVSAGNSPFEFMAEAILNLSKCLDIVFGQSMDQVRQELQKLEYSTSDIEEIFVPLLVLRNHLDVGHATLALLGRDELDVLHDYLVVSIYDFQALLRKVVDLVVAGKYEVKGDYEREPDTDKRRKIDQLVGSFRARLNKHPWWNEKEK